MLLTIRRLIKSEKSVSGFTSKYDFPAECRLKVHLYVARRGMSLPHTIKCEIHIVWKV
jgi:hypothetical protein